MRMIAVLSLIEEPAVRPNLGGSQDLLSGPQDDAHRLIGEYHRKGRHAREPSNNLAAGLSCYVPTCQRVMNLSEARSVNQTRSALTSACRADAAA